MSTFKGNTYKGLSSREIPLKKKLFGDNQLEETKHISLSGLFFNQFKDFMTLVLIGAIIISAYLGEIADALAITAIVILNGILGFIQEYRTEKSLEALKQLSAPTAKVIRDGKITTIAAKDVIPGDVVILESGARIPADGEVIMAENLYVDESILTGESAPVEKTIEAGGSELKIHRKNLAFMGTLVVSGHGRMIITAIGMETEMGKIAGMISKIEEEQTPLQKRLDILGKQLVIVSILVCAVVAFLGVLRGEKIHEMFLFGVSLAVAAIPEGLPAIVTVVLTLGVQRMIKKNAIIRKLPAVETLGCATVICSDKTGTLTENKMTVRKVFFNSEFVTVTGTGYRAEGNFISSNGAILKNLPAELIRLLEIGVSCNNSIVSHEKGSLFGIGKSKELSVSGDPTEAAIIIAGIKGGCMKENINSLYKRIREIPFDSNRKRMSVIVESRQGELYLFTKGAPDVILPLCSHIEERGSTRELLKKDEKTIIAANESMGQEALRVLAFAYKKLSFTQLEQKDPEQGLIFVGLMGMIDPPRPEAIEAIQKCFASGIRPVMITGDHKSTAWAVAKELKMVQSHSKMLTGQELDRLSDAELLKKIDEIAVFSRVTPRHKLRIVKALKDKGNVVAMTGDGVNDAPAVKEADIGVSMGIAGTDVTKEASAMILTDDNFASIVAAIEEGRIIYDNIRKFIRYLLSCNIGEIFTMLWTSALGLPIPLLPIQILWMNLVTDGLPAMALGIDPPQRDVMRRKPRGKNENIFSGGLAKKIVYRGLLISIATVAAFIITGYYTDGNVEIARTAAFSTLVMSQLIFVFECRSEKQLNFRDNPFSNIYLNLAVIVSAGMMFMVVHVPLFQPIFHTTGLDINIWVMVFALAGLSAII